MHKGLRGLDLYNLLYLGLKTNRIFPMTVNGVEKYLTIGNTEVEIVLKSEEQLFLLIIFCNYRLIKLYAVHSQVHSGEYISQCLNDSFVILLMVNGDEYYLPEVV